MSRSSSEAGDWFAQSFDDHYARIYEYKDDTALAEVSQMLRYLHLRRKPLGSPQRILDLACGWGRHTVPLALRGFNVTGVDFSDVMLRLAERRASESGLQVRWLDAKGTPRHDGPPAAHADGPSTKTLTLLQADMRSLPFREDFDVVIDVFTSFGYFRDPDDNDAVLDAVYAALSPGGKFLLDIDNPQVFIDKGTGENTFNVARNGDQERVLRVEKYARVPDRRVVEYSFIDRPSDSREEIYLECKLYDREEITALLARHNFGVEKKIWGDFAGTLFNQDTSPRLITIAVKPE